MFAAPIVPADKLERGTVRIGDVRLPIGCAPFIVEGLVDRWPAARRWTAQSLSASHGSEPVECFAVPRKDGTFLQQTSERRRMSFRRFLAHVHDEGPADELFYLRFDAGHPIFRDLSSDFEIPDMLDRYQPDATGIWIGQRGNVTPFHHDWWHSCLAQVRGRKQYVLVHPMEGRTLQAAWSAASRFDLEAAPPFDPAGAGRFTMAFTGVLKPGQMLYIPPYWLHQVDTLDNGNISIPIRFDTDQSPDVDLFQLSQESSLRPLTNHPVSDEKTVVDVLRSNRARFDRSEREFVEALCEARELDSEPDWILAACGGTGVSTKNGEAPG